MKPVCIALAFALCACQQQSPDEKLKDTAKTAASWAATLSFAGEQWIANRVPKRFIRTAVDAAKTGFDRSQKEVSGSGASRSQRDRIGHDIAEANRLGSQLRDVADRGDRTAAAALASRLDHVAKDLLR